MGKLMSDLTEIMSQFDIEWIRGTGRPLAARVVIIEERLRSRERALAD